MISCKQILHVCGGMCAFPARHFWLSKNSENITINCSRNVFSGTFYFGSQNVLLKGRITFSKNILNIFGDNFLKMYERIERMNRTYKNEFMHANIHSHALIITLKVCRPTDFIISYV